jgi:hypothetical protein
MHISRLAPNLEQPAAALDAGDASEEAFLVDPRVEVTARVGTADTARITSNEAVRDEALARPCHDDVTDRWQSGAIDE